MVVIVGDCRQKVTEILKSITKQYILGSKNQDFLLLKEKNGIFDCRRIESNFGEGSVVAFGIVEMNIW